MNRRMDLKSIEEMKQSILAHFDKISEKDILSLTNRSHLQIKNKEEFRNILNQVNFGDKTAVDYLLPLGEDSQSLQQNIRNQPSTPQAVMTGGRRKHTRRNKRRYRSTQKGGGFQIPSGSFIPQYVEETDRARARSMGLSPYEIRQSRLPQEVDSMSVLCVVILLLYLGYAYILTPAAGFLGGRN